jgi:hypothetical protein
MAHSAIGSCSRNLRGMLCALYAVAEFARYLNALYLVTSAGWDLPSPRLWQAWTRHSAGWTDHGSHISIYLLCRFTDSAQNPQFLGNIWSIMETERNTVMEGGKEGTNQTMWYVRCLHGSYPDHEQFLLHVAEPFCRGRQLCSYSETSQRFMEPKGSLTCSQEPHPTSL